MASLRRLSIHESSIHRVPAAFRASPKVRAANYQYWASHAGRSYGRSNIYVKDAYYTRWIDQRNTRYARTCGSWARRRTRGSPLEDVKQEKDGLRTENASTQSTDKRSKNRGLFGDDRFFDLLRHDATAAYHYLQKELERDPYRWLFDPKETNSAWNPGEWWHKRRRTFDRAYNSAESTHSEDDITKAASSVEAVEEEFTIDPITLRKVPVSKTKIESTNQDELYPQYQGNQGKQGSAEHEIPVKMHSAVDATGKMSQEPRSNRLKNDTRLSGFKDQPWLIKEGFRLAENASPGSSDLQSRTTIEPSLDRLAKPVPKPSKAMEYPPSEKLTDDVDLLRASDIRAASGHVKQKQSPSKAEIQERSKALEDDWETAGKVWNNRLSETYNNIAESQNAKPMNKAPEPIETPIESESIIELRKAKKHHDELETQIRQAAELLEKARRGVLRDFLTQETNNVRNNFDSFESRARQPVLSSIALDDATQPTYKDRGIGRNGSGQDSTPGRSERDAELIRQIKAIYEESYGPITSISRSEAIGHIESSKNSSPVSQDSSTEMVLPMEGSLGNVSSSASKLAYQQQDHSISPSSVLPVRDLLYSSIDGLNISVAAQRRLKFALRGVPELDAPVPRFMSSEQGLLSESAAVSKPEFVSSATPINGQDTVTEQPNMPQTDIKVASQKHRHHNQSEEILSSKKVEENTYIYKILALDNATNEIAVATTTSSIKHKSSVPRSAAGLLVHLDQPAKYFSYMESLDAKGFQLVSGSRTMLVYRQKVGPNGTAPEPSSNLSEQASTSMKPLREEPVFSGHLKPKDRLIRSYQLAHRRARSLTDEAGDRMDNTSSEYGNSEEHQERRDGTMKGRIYRSLMGKTGTVALAVMVCYIVGLVQNRKNRKEAEEGARLRKQEAALRRVEAQKNQWTWF